LPLVSEVIVVVTEAAVTSERFGAPSSSTRKVDPEGFENCRLAVVPSAAFNCATTELMPPEKSTPRTSSFGSSVAPLPSGSTDGSSTRTIERLCVAPVVLSL
jgi:hypothetical protein